MARPPSTPFGRLIDAHMKRMGLSQTAAARLAGMPTSTLSHLISGLVQGRSRWIETGEPGEDRRPRHPRGPGPSTAAALTAGYRVSDPRCSDREFLIVLKTRRLDPHDLDSVEERIDYLGNGRA